MTDINQKLTEMAAPFNDPKYWLGGGHGYQAEGGGAVAYRDFETNRFKVEQVLRLKPQKLLEVGCAYGFNVARFRRVGIDALGLDISDFAISQASDDVRPFLRQGVAHQLPWPDNSFDVLCCFGTLEHVPEEYVVPTLKEFARVAPRGVLSVTMKGDPRAEEDSSHISLLTYREWEALAAEHCPNYEIYSDAGEYWRSMSHRRWCLIAPTIYPLGKTGYAGIERLAVLFLKGLLEEAMARGDWEVACFCTIGSVVPRGARRISTGPPLMDFREPNLLPSMAVWGAQASCYLDFSHSKPNPWDTQISVIWHDPFIMQPPQPPTNVVALSEWQAERFRKVYKQDCRVLAPICGDGDILRPKILHPGGELGSSEDDYLVFLGKLSPDKGALEAIEACRALKQKLVLIGPVTPGDPPEYAQRVIQSCDGENIVYLPQVTGDQKVEIFQRAKALFYPVSYPHGQGEAHSHKSIEAMLCGTPCILYDQGAMKEVVDEGITGFVIRGREGLEGAIKACETLDRQSCRDWALLRWDYRRVVQKWLPVMDAVSRGDRW